MPLTLPTDTTDAISLEEFFDFVARTVDARDFASGLAAAEKLRALANNQTFLVDRVNRELRRWETFQQDNVFTAQTLMLGQTSDFLVRAVIWEPIVGSDPNAMSLQNTLFDYRIPHDHNFSFLTVGYFGSGYETTVYDYDRDEVVGIPGERVELRFVDRTTLSRGKVMAYQARKDVHVQAPPPDLSVSINLILNPSEASGTEQYLFDLETSSLVGVGHSPSAARASLCQLVQHIADDETPSLLEVVAKRHACFRTRASALDSLATLKADAAERVWAMALDDAHEAVRWRARQRLDRLSGKAK